MKKLTLIAAAVLTAVTSYAQTAATAENVSSVNTTHGKNVSTAAQSYTTADASSQGSNKGAYVSTIARSKKEATITASGEFAQESKEAAKENKEQAKQFLKEQKETASSQKEEFSSAAYGTEATVSANALLAQHTVQKNAASLSETTLTGAALAEASAPGQERPKKARNREEKPSDRQTEEPEVKEVATAKRQDKPEKVDAQADVTVDVKASKSAARPGRGATRVVKSTASTATKTVGNAVKAVKPVKVGGSVGVGSVIKIGKN